MLRMKMDRQQSENAIRDGIYAAYIIAIFFLVVTIVGMVIGAGFADPYDFIGVGVLLLCAYGMQKKYRLAAFILFFISLIDFIYGFTSAESDVNITGMIFLAGAVYYFGRAMTGMFVYHQIEKKENPDYSPPRRWPVVVFALLILITGAIGVLEIIIGDSETGGMVLMDEVLSQPDISVDVIKLLVENKIVSTDDVVEYYYSDGVNSILDSGYLLTENAVISYAINDDGYLEVNTHAIADIVRVVQTRKGDGVSDNCYKVNTNNQGECFNLNLAPKGNGDNLFIEALRSKIIR